MPSKEAQFRDWRREVNQHLVARIGLSGDDLPDVDYYSMFLDEMKPLEAARAVVESACEDMLMDDNWIGDLFN